MRTQYGLEPFVGYESDFADFTIDDIEASYKITQWLARSGLMGEEADIDSHRNYHFEVKATSGSCDEPFSISSNQIALVSLFYEIVDTCHTLTNPSHLQAHGCRDSPFHVFAILRVYNVLSQQPKIKTYVDPIAHEEAGTLIFTHVGGFSVRPS